jgi:adenylate cyclase
MERRLAAILAADVVSYSRLMGDDEAGTFARLKACRRELIDPAIEEFHGRIVKLMGDGTLVEFASVVDAVQCAAAIQRAMAKRDQDISEASRIRLRIGVNLGDVIVEGDDLYGDGVNIAARLEAIAEPGGICVSGTAFDHAMHKADVGFASLGEQRLKNIADPVRVYRILLEPGAAGRVVASTRKRGTLLLLSGLAGALLVAGIAILFTWQSSAPTERPSIAVLPFANLGGDPKEAYFADGITEDLITDLAKLSGLDVIAGNSVFKYKDQPVVLPDVARDLGVRYVVEGSVKRSGDRIGVTLQLVDTVTGSHLWADRFERSTSDVFVVQDAVVRNIVEVLGIRPTEMERERMAHPPTTNLEAYDYYLRGEQAERTGLRPKLREALELYEKAIALDPSFAAAYAADARIAVYVWRNTYDDVLSTPVARKRAYEKAGRALELNQESSLPFAILAVLQVVDGKFEEAVASARRAAALGPGDVEAHVALSFVLTAAGLHAEAVAAIETAMRLDPELAANDLQVAGLTFLTQGDSARAIQAMERARTQAPGVDDVHALLAAAYATAGRMVEAKAEASEALRLSPIISIGGQRMGYSYFRNNEDLETIVSAMRKAGFPEWPFGFHGDESNRLSGPDIAALALGRTWRGNTETGSPAIYQIGSDGKMAFRTPTRMLTGMAFVRLDSLCEQSDSVALGRANCGPVYRKASKAGSPAYTYVNSTRVFDFSPAD